MHTYIHTYICMIPKLYRCFKIHFRIKQWIVVPLTCSTLPVFISLTKLNALCVTVLCG